MHSSVVAGVELFGGEQFGDISNHIEVVVDPLAAEYEPIASAQKGFFDALP